MSSADNHAADQPAESESPDVGDIAARPKSPAVIRFLGCEAEMAGLSTDYFTAGRTDDCDLRVPDAMGGEPSIVLRFSRGAEGWRVSPSDKAPVFVNQEQVRGLTPLRSGDVIRFVPGGAGMQFTIVHQNAASLASLAAKYAPRLMGEKPSDRSGERAALGNDSPADGASPLRYEAGGGAASAAAANIPLPEEKPRRLDPAVLVASSILLAGLIAGAAFVYSAELKEFFAGSTEDAAAPTEPAVEGNSDEGGDPVDPPAPPPTPVVEADDDERGGGPFVAEDSEPEAELTDPQPEQPEPVVADDPPTAPDQRTEPTSDTSSGLDDDPFGDSE